MSRHRYFTTQNGKELKWKVASERLEVNTVIWFPTPYWLIPELYG